MSTFDAEYCASAAAYCLYTKPTRHALATTAEAAIVQAIMVVQVRHMAHMGLEQQLSMRMFKGSQSSEKKVLKDCYVVLVLVPGFSARS